MYPGSVETQSREGTAEQAVAAEAFVAAFVEGWRDPGSADGLVAAFSPYLCPDVRLIQPQMPTLVGLEDFRRGFAEPLYELMPDARGEVEHWAARGDVVYIVVTVSGTLGGKPAALRSCDRITLRDGRVAERVAYVDPGPLLGAALTRPRAWPALLRAQARMLRFRLRRRTSR